MCLFLIIFLRKGFLWNDNIFIMDSRYIAKRSILFTKVLCLFAKVSHFVRESYAIYRESIAFIREIYELISKNYAFYRESFAFIREFFFFQRKRAEWVFVLLVIENNGILNISLRIPFPWDWYLQYHILVVIHYQCEIMV